MSKVLKVPKVPKVVAIIPARAGSKGLPGKNLSLIHSKPLLAYTAEAAVASGVFSDIVLSSDDDAILEAGRKLGLTAMRRPSQLATDTSTTDEVIDDFIKQQQLIADTIVVLLQPTSPLRNAKHIQLAYKQFIETCYQHDEAHLLQSVYPVDSKFLYAYHGEGLYIKALSKLASDVARRQDLPQLYLPNGAIYIFTVAGFITNHQIPRAHIVPFVMSELDSVDIDTAEDLQHCAARLSMPPDFLD